MEMSELIRQIEDALQQVKGLTARSSLEACLLNGESSVACLVGRALDGEAVFPLVKRLVAASWDAANNRRGCLYRLWHATIPRALTSLIKIAQDKKPQDRVIVGTTAASPAWRPPSLLETIADAAIDYEEVETDGKPKPWVDKPPLRVLRPVGSWADAGNELLRRILKNPLVATEDLLRPGSDIYRDMTRIELVPYLRHPFLGDFCAAHVWNRLAFMVNTVAEFAHDIEVAAPGRLIKAFRKAAEELELSGVPGRRAAWTLVEIHLVGLRRLARTDVLPDVPKLYDDLITVLETHIVRDAGQLPLYVRDTARRQHLQTVISQQIGEVKALVVEALEWLLSEVKGIEDHRLPSPSKNKREKNKMLTAQRNKDIVRWTHEGKNPTVVLAMVEKEYKLKLPARFWHLKLGSLKRIIRDHA